MADNNRRSKRPARPRTSSSGRPRPTRGAAGAAQPQPATGQKKRKPLSEAHKRAISIALSRSQGPTAGIDKPEPKGRKRGRKAQPEQGKKRRQIKKVAPPKQRYKQDLKKVEAMTRDNPKAQASFKAKVARTIAEAQANPTPKNQRNAAKAQAIAKDLGMKAPAKPEPLGRKAPAETKLGPVNRGTKDAAKIASDAKDKPRLTSDTDTDGGKGKGKGKGKGSGGGGGKGSGKGGAGNPPEPNTPEYRDAQARRAEADRKLNAAVASVHEPGIDRSTPQGKADYDHREAQKRLEVSKLNAERAQAHADAMRAIERSLPANSPHKKKAKQDAEQAEFYARMAHKEVASTAEYASKVQARRDRVAATPPSNRKTTGKNTSGSKKGTKTSGNSKAAPKYPDLKRMSDTALRLLASGSTERAKAAKALLGKRG